MSDPALPSPGASLLTRRALLENAAVLIGTISATSVVATLTPSRVWALEMTTFSKPQGEALLAFAQTLYPHPKLPSAAYALVVKHIDHIAATEPPKGALVHAGVPKLDAAAHGSFAHASPSARLAAAKSLAGSPFFELVRSTCINKLYDNQIAWAHFGYQGASWPKGGYKHRGFNDLAWLPNPPEDASPTVGLLLRRERMARISNDDGSAVVIIGSGAGGGTLANELTQKGVRVVLLEAGKRQSSATFVNDEWPSFNQLAWLDKRTTSGTWRVAKDFPNLPAWTCKTVGGTTTHWAGASLRIQPHEFKARTTYGNVKDAALLDWPLTRDELDPYYAKAEHKLGVTRTFGMPGLPGNNNFKVFYNGAKRVGYTKCSTGHMAVNSVVHDGRIGCLQLGFCFQGCKSGAKWSTLYTEIPHAEATGLLDLRPESQALHIETSPSGKASAVVYVDAAGKMQRQKARVVSVAANTIETARLLLNSSSSRFPDGLANGSGQVGRNYMRHMTGSVYAVFDHPVHMYRGTTMAGIIQDENGHDTARGFAGGYEMETISLGLPFFAAFLDPGAWGSDFAYFMDNYANVAGMWIVGEDMPRSTNRVTLNKSVKDQHGMPVPNVHYDDHPNDVAMRNHAYERGARVYESVGALKVFKTPPYPSTHNLGTARMSVKPADGVVDPHGRAHDVKNLFISDGSVFTTSAAENPTLTIVTLAIRQAEYIADAMKRGSV